MRKKMDSACGKNTREMAYGSRQNKVLRALLLIRMWSNMHAYAPHDQINFYFTVYFYSSYLNLLLFRYKKMI